VKLHARHYGRGPTKAKTHLTQDLAVCVLEEVFMPAEKTLIAAGNSQQVRSTRDAFQLALEDDFVAIVEQATGRKVRGFFSQVHIGSETAIEFFLFEPDAPPRRAADTPEPSQDGDGGPPEPSLDGDGGPPPG
jgi:uncharacterized protein YbcI